MFVIFLFRTIGNTQYCVDKEILPEASEIIDLSASSDIPLFECINVVQEDNSLCQGTDWSDASASLTSPTSTSAPTQLHKASGQMTPPVQKQRRRKLSNAQSGSSSELEGALLDYLQSKL